MPDLGSFFTDVSEQLSESLDRLSPPVTSPPEKLHLAIRWSLFGGGKHLRPALVFAFGRAFGASDAQLLRTAAAVEMIHTYSLIHDDLPSMDDDDLRRGRETCHRKFGEATAILAGDALQALAFQVIAEDDALPADTRVELTSRLARAAARMVTGQQLDLDAEGQETSIELIETIHRNKTGALIRFSAEAGAIIANASSEELAAVSSVAEKLGLLFQITDDLLDVTQTTEELGKTAGKDVAVSKATYPAIRGIDETTELARRMHGDVVKSLAAFSVPTELIAGIANFIVDRSS